MQYQVMYAAYPTGPFFQYDLEQLRQKFAAGEIQSDTMVRQFPHEPWMPIADALNTEGEAVAEPGAVPSAAPVLASSKQGVHFASQASGRYRDGYLIARATNGIGGVVKFVAVALAIVTVLFGLLVASQTNGIFALAAIVLAVQTGVPLYILGILLSAQGQILKATLDSAVHTSPFLTDQQKATAMSL